MEGRRRGERGHVDVYVGRLPPLGIISLCQHWLKELRSTNQRDEIEEGREAGRDGGESRERCPYVVEMKGCPKWCDFFSDLHRRDFNVNVNSRQLSVRNHFLSQSPTIGPASVRVHLASATGMGKGAPRAIA